VLDYQDRLGCRSNWRNSLLWVKPLFATIRGAAVEVDEVAPELEKRSWTATSLCRGTGVVVQWWRQWSIPSLATLPWSVRVSQWGVAAPVNLVSWALAPTYYLLRCATGPTSLVLGWAPDQGVRSRDQLAQRPTGGDQFHHSPPWSPLILSSLYLLLLFIFHHKLMHRAVSSSWSVADRFNSYNTCLCSEIDTLTLGPFIVRKI